MDRRFGKHRGAATLDPYKSQHVGVDRSDNIRAGTIAELNNIGRPESEGAASATKPSTLTVTVGISYASLRLGQPD